METPDVKKTEDNPTSGSKPLERLKYDQEDLFNEQITKITDEPLKAKFEEMKALIVERINLERDFRIEQCKLEAKYEKLYAPFYTERKEIVEGSKKVEKAKVEGVLKDIKLSDETEEKEKGVPEYWLKCLKNTAQFGDYLNNNDEKILKYLENITLDLQEGGDFEIMFHFGKNEYFEHEILSKKFIHDDKQAIKSCVATKIQWASEEVNPTVKKVKKKLKNSKLYVLCFYVLFNYFAVEVLIFVVIFRDEAWESEDCL